MPTIVHASNCKPPHAGRDFADEQILYGHRLKNALVEQERRRRERCADALIRHYPQIDELTQKVDALSEQIDNLQAEVKRKNAKTKSRSATKEQKKKIASLKGQRKAARAELKLAKEHAWSLPPELEDVIERLKMEYKHLPAGSRSRNKPPHVIALETDRDQKQAELRDSRPFFADLADIEADHKEECARLERESGVGWGSRWTTRESVKRSGPPPKFKSWDGCGTIDVQIQGGLSFDEAQSGEDARLHIERLSPHAWDNTSPRGKKHRRTIAHVTVGMDRHTKPVTISVRCNIDRPIPDDARIKWVRLSRKRVGKKNHWSLQLTLQQPSAKKPDCARTGRVGIDVGWRLMERGLRVAYWVGDDGESGSLVIPTAELDRYRIPSELRCDRDERFNVMIARTIDWLQAHGDLPEPVVEAARHIGKWRSQAKLARLMHVISEHMPGTDILPELRHWNREDEKVLKVEAHTRQKWIRRRRHLYRDFAAKMRRRYQTAVMEKVRWGQMHRLPEPEDASRDGALTHHIRVCSPYELQQTIGNSMAKTVWLPAKDTTRLCNVCGEYTGEPNPEHLFHTCQHCGNRQDQDRIAAVNLLLGEEPASGAEKSK